MPADCTFSINGDVVVRGVFISSDGPVDGWSRVIEYNAPIDPPPVQGVDFDPPGT